MDRELITKLKKELRNIAILFVIALVMFKILFYKEGFLVILRTVAAFFWMFILPGFYLMYYWHERIKFVERLVIGVAISAAIIGISSYYLGLIGLHAKYHGILLPLIFLIIGGALLIKKIKG